MPVQITTSTAATATAYSNQRKLDRTSNGVLWSWRGAALASNVTVYLGFYSLDNGATWTDPGSPSRFQASSGTHNYVANCSVFIDADDYAHIAYKDSNDGFIYYRRGTPNAARTAWTWSAATQIGASNATYDYPDIVAHREGTGWAAHVVFSQPSFGNAKVQHCKVGITSGGIISAGLATSIAGASYTANAASFPSIDFHHTGDGKTVKDGTPHLYVGWSAGASGAGQGIRFRKAVYSGGSWTWNPEREIDPNYYVVGTFHRVETLFDGARVVMVADVRTGSSTDAVNLYERDAADTATTTRVLLAGPVASAERLTYGSSSYDGQGNIYLVGANLDEGSGLKDLVYRKWTRSGASLGPEVVIDSNVEVPYVSAKRGFSGNLVEFIYTDGTASPYTVTYDKIELPALMPYVPMIML